MAKVHADWMDDAKSHYESRPQRSPLQWLESQATYDWLYAVFELKMERAKDCAVIEKHHIDMTQFEWARKYSSSIQDRKVSSAARRPGARDIVN